MKNAPPLSFFWVSAPRAELASLLSVGDGAVSEAGKGVLFIGNFMPGMWVGHVSRNSETDKSQTRTQPLPQPGRRSTVSHEVAVVAAETGVVDHPELRRCRVGMPPLRPHRTLQFKCRRVNARGWSALYHLSDRRGNWGRRTFPRGRRFTRTTQASPRA